MARGAFRHKVAYELIPLSLLDREAGGNGIRAIWTERRRFGSCPGWRRSRTGLQKCDCDRLHAEDATLVFAPGAPRSHRATRLMAGRSARSESASRADHWLSLSSSTQAISSK